MSKRVNVKGIGTKFNPSLSARHDPYRHSVFPAATGNIAQLKFILTSSHCIGIGSCTGAVGMKLRTVVGQARYARICEDLVSSLSHHIGKRRQRHELVRGDEPVSIDEAQGLALVILGPTMPYSGKDAIKSPARTR